MIADNRTFIDRFKGTFSKTDAVQSRVKMLEKLVIVQVDEVDNSSLKFSCYSSFGAISSKGLDKSIWGACGFKDANIVIERGEKVAFVGKMEKGSRP
jgi:ATP-binding cassette subfamily F protein 3